MRWWWAFVIPFMLCLVCAGPGQATTPNELKVAVRVFDFLTVPPRGPTPLAVIFDGQNKASLEDALAIQEGLKSGVSSAKAELLPVLVDARHLDEFPDLHVGVVAFGTGAYFDRILGYAIKNHTVTISSDPSCMQSGKCTVGIGSSPRVEVIINRAVAASCGIEFSEAFRMMVREF
ncbi:hypothetical protein [Telmatospirillum sp.]|uniref:hypothetical protein n=1 Tax=Telmatospirillum sp. TaxID=2079197 RepID=UPI00284D9DF9|nr:hypothetical protein [Telmatospirillum sp.]MDR3435197.1 hypothetical protein [Telmatospirillum sp.]